MIVLPTNIDMDILRTFVTGVTLGNFSKAAEQLGRSPSAVSMQLRKLEEQTGQTLLLKSGRGLALTEAGETLFGYARQILDLNDEAMARLSGPGQLKGWVRIGLPEDFAENWLPAMLGRFTRFHPKVRLEVRIGGSATLLKAIRNNQLDVALAWGDALTPGCQVIARYPVSWIGQDSFRHDMREPLPLVAFDPPCLFRSIALAALERNGLNWRHVFASPSLAGLWAAISAGLGITPRITAGMPKHLQIIDTEKTGLPPLGEIDLILHRTDTGSKPVDHLIELLLEAIPA